MSSNKNDLVRKVAHMSDDLVRYRLCQTCLQCGPARRCIDCQMMPVTAT